MNDALAAKIRKLNLAGMIQTVDARVGQAIKEKLSYVEFLELIINDEHLNRGRNRKNELVRKARFPQHKTIEEFDFSWQPGLNRQEIYGLGTCEFIRKRENIAFIGLPGTGKTHLAISLGVRAIEQGYSVMFTSLSDMMEELYLSRADNSFRQKLKKYTSPDALIIDEFGLKKLNQTSVDDLYEVISKRYEINSTIITSNKEFSEWGHVLFDPVLASAILDRFVHHCNFVSIDGDSYRMKERIGFSGSRRRGRPKKDARPGDKSETENAMERDE
jgi:DNA replication protein DnaC